MNYYLELCNDAYPTPAWRVVAHANGQNEDQCDFILWVEALDSAMRKDALTVLAKLLRVCASDSGPTIFNPDECHHVHTARVRAPSGGYRNEKIWQLSGRQVRLLWFYGGDGKVVVVSHCYVKKTKTTPAGERDKAERLCQKYFEAVQKQQLKIFREE